VHDVVGLRLTQALDLDVILIAPEVRHRYDLGHVLTHHRRHEHARLVGDVAPMLNAHLMSRDMAPGGDVSDSPHVRHTAAARLVADDAVVQLDACAVEPVGRGA
jgi:hypothetical protein